MNEQIDIKVIAQAALSQAESLLWDLLPGGKRVGAEWESTNPNRIDNRPGSFKVNIKTGKWSDFAIHGEKGGGDLVSLYAYLNNVSQFEAAKAVAGFIGMSVPDHHPKAKQKTPIVPVPPDAPECTFKIPKYGDPTGMWPYHDADENLLFYRMRFDFMEDGEPKKTVLPVTYCDLGNGKCAWRAKDIPGLKPLYRLPQLLSRPDAKVLIVEGEKAADAAQILFPDWVVVTWSGGSKAIEKTDWSPLAGRDVAIWPDADIAGYSAALALMHRLNEEVSS